MSFGGATNREDSRLDVRVNDFIKGAIEKFHTIAIKLKDTH